MSVQEQIVGIGVVLEPSATGNLQVTKLVPGGPAQMQGGMAVGDVLIAVDGSDVRGMSLDKVAPLIRGSVGTQVSLTILRPGSSESVSVTLTRQPTAKLVGLSSGRERMPKDDGAAHGGSFEETIPKQTLDKLRQLRLTMEQERIAVAKEREQSARMQATLEDQVEKLESRCKQLLQALEDLSEGKTTHIDCGHRYLVPWCSKCNA
ncbi:hypothetical protein GUITHDRAFT_136389 [Guillardia theta CCMP2712]|uniref:PDZ domain-containing protein n=1 Tax=Guillardia theta (strain CCMP2712) TaxID=905079 RepID=L1JKN4_GUITC|nr:hypothetical protein GUITHDRAFT_136389 [Guillardia theta CCMP2712]EKX48694.1 hypothetical protein GUITHDRAFT_136389 [Guillardia theta CCMP2712]|mmetsp:Transcript_40766/g.128469  ORF Transcript_40766/g.128469 Transcript_40766/m.128469 type:complete len:206 (-) Transcript_40766:210-827(-)|eukprot:XP_005835674.1 hypothetical protein GUITHDRAFT_136389 [Guillardia theta CCMP2712]